MSSIANPLSHDRAARTAIGAMSDALGILPDHELPIVEARCGAYIVARIPPIDQSLFDLDALAAERALRAGLYGVSQALFGEGASL